LKGKSIIIIEDIVESGITIQAVIEELQKLEPADIRIATCFTKVGKLKIPLKIDYLAMEVLDRFIIGYGLDWDEWGRGLEGLYYIE
jgi:hypoxanthine phosphoribosyltransferase